MLAWPPNYTFGSDEFDVAFRSYDSPQWRKVCFLGFLWDQGVKFKATNKKKGQLPEGNWPRIEL